MAKKKNIRQRGKLQLSEYFKTMKEGEKVSISVEKSIPSSFPKRVIGMAGTIIGQRGNHKIVKIKDGGLYKDFIIHPIHLRKLK